MKKGQVTLFLALGIIMLLMLGFAIFTKNIKFVENIDNPVTFIESSVKSCLKISGERALKIIGLQGRIYTDDYFEYSSNKAYYAYKDENRLITIEELEKEISKYIKEDVEQCINNLVEEARGLEASFGTPEVKTLIADKNIMVTLDYPINIFFDDQTYAVSEFSQDFKVRLKKMHEVSANVVSLYEERQTINMTYLNSLDLLTTIIPYEDKTIVFFLEDKNSNIENQLGAYSFAVR